VQVSGAVRPGTGIGLLQRAEYLRRERDGRRPRYQHRSRFLRRTDPYIADMCMESTQRDRFANWLTTSARHTPLRTERSFNEENIHSGSRRFGNRGARVIAPACRCAQS
jgi:hypothetical protein